MTDIEAIKKRHERLRNRGKGVKWWHQLSSFAKARIRCLHEDRETLLAALEAAQAEAAHYIRMTKQFRLTAEQRLAELEAKDKRIQELEKELPMHRLSTEAIGECRRIIKEIMGNHAAFIDDDVARTLLHMKDKIAKLEKQIQELNTNVSDCCQRSLYLRPTRPSWKRSRMRLKPTQKSRINAALMRYLSHSQRWLAMTVWTLMRLNTSWTRTGD